MDEISLAFTATKSALQLAKGLIGLSKDVAVQQKAAELFGIITDLHEKVQNLQSLIAKTERTIDEWKQKALQRQAWDKTKMGYSTYHPTPGVTVYITKKDSALGDQAEWLCKHCADIEMVPSTFQLVNHSAAGKQFGCHQCGFKFLIPEKRYGGSHRIKPRPFI